MGSRRRLVIVILISLGLHLAGLAVRFQRDAPLAGSKGYFVGLVPGRTLPQFSDEHSPPISAQRQGSAGPAVTRNVEPPLPIPKPVQEPEQIAAKTTQPLPRSQSSIPPLTASAPVVEKRSPTPEAEIAPLSLGALQPAVAISATAVSGPAAEAGGASPIAGISTSPARRAVPRYAQNPRPVYPEIARRKGWAGEVRLRVQVDQSGRVEGLFVSSSSGYPILDRAARKAVRLWRFVPAREGERNIAREVVVPVEFRLPNDSSEEFPLEPR